MLTPKQYEFLTLASRAAVHAERIYGVPAELTVAQAVLGSGWGAKTPGNNCLGILATPRHLQSVVVPTHEVFTEPQIRAWNQKHPQAPASIVSGLGDGLFRVEVEETFAAFDSLGDCFDQHAIMLSSRAPFDVMLAKLDEDNLPAYVERVAKVYSTEPDYGRRVLAVMSMHAVQDALSAARKGVARA